MIEGEKIVLSSVNCRGLQDLKKRRDVLDYLKNLNSNITCLQDTHLTLKNEREIKEIWNNPFLHKWNIDKL